MPLFYYGKFNGVNNPKRLFLRIFLIKSNYRVFGGRVFFLWKVFIAASTPFLMSV